MSTLFSVTDVLLKPRALSFLDWTLAASSTSKREREHERERYNIMVYIYTYWTILIALIAWWKKTSFLFLVGCCQICLEELWCMRVSLIWEALGFLWPTALLHTHCISLSDLGWFKGASQDSRASGGIHGYASIKDMLNPDGMQRLETRLFCWKVIKVPLLAQFC